MSKRLIEHPNVPLYVRLAEQLRSQVRSRQLQPGDRLPSFAEMKAEGVSQNTLERTHALLEREGLIVRERGKGIFIAKSLPITMPVIGIVREIFTETHAFYFAEILMGIQEAAQQAQVRLSLLSPDGDAAQWEEVDGVLVWEGSPGKPVAKLPTHLPQVSILLSAGKTPSVNVADYDGTRAAMEHLLQLGHRRIAYLMVSDHPVLATRLRAYRDALSEAGIVADPRWVRHRRVPLGQGGHRVEQGRRSMRQWFEEDWKELGCTALLVQNDFIALGVLDVCREEGWRVPDDVSVVGFDGLEVGDMISPRLTTVEVPLRRVGSTALEILLHQLRDEELSPHVELPVRLKIRESTAPPAS